MSLLSQADLLAYKDLPTPVRRELDAWREVCEQAVQPIKPGKRAPRTEEYWAVRTARRMGVSVGTAVRKYYAYQKQGWRGLVDLAKCPDWKKRWVDGQLAEADASEEFLEWFKAQAERNQRKTRPAWRKFCALWASGAHIPGLDNSLPRHHLPPGCSYSRLQKRTQDVFAKEAMRIGLASAVGKYGPQVFSTRVGLYVGSHVMIDDLWHDNFVTFKGKPVRVLELDLLDVFSGNKAAWGTKPRFLREDGTFDNLKEKYARLIVAQYFWNHGFSPRGTVILAEHGTAAISERVARILHDRTSGLIRLRESGITGQEQAIVGYYGQGKGNFRFKAALESLRNLIHNELGDVAGQTGMDVAHRPEWLHGVLRQADDFAKAAAVVALSDPQRARQIRNPLLEYHSEFLPLLTDVYARMNARDWHQLEGWHQCGHVTTKYRLSANQTQWLLPEEFNQQPEGIRNAVLAEIQRGDERYTAPHVMSPAEVFQAGRAQLERLPMFVVAEVLADDYASERAVRGAYFNEFSDHEIAPEPLLFESVVVTPEGQREQLRDGTYMVFVNPFDPHWLFVHDAKGRCLGVAQRARKVSRLDEAAVAREFGQRNRRLAELLQPVRKRHADLTQRQSDDARMAAEALAEPAEPRTRRATVNFGKAVLATEANTSAKQEQQPEETYDLT